MLIGTEVKSLRDGKASVSEAYAAILNSEVWLIGCHIAAYDHAGINHDPDRTRKLLLHRREIAKLVPQVVRKGQTLIPLDIHFNERGIAKVMLALCKGKSRSDKRQAMRERDHKREMERAAKK